MIYFLSSGILPESNLCVPPWYFFLFFLLDTFAFFIPTFVVPLNPQEFLSILLFNFCLTVLSIPLVLSLSSLWSLYPAYYPYLLHEISLPSLLSLYSAYYPYLIHEISLPSLLSLYPVSLSYSRVIPPLLVTGWLTGIAAVRKPKLRNCLHISLC